MGARSEQEGMGLFGIQARYSTVNFRTNRNQKFNMEEWMRLKKAMVELFKVVLKLAHVIIATAIQGAMDLLKDIDFDQTIIDEASVLTYAEMLCAWRGVEKFPKEMKCGFPRAAVSGTQPRAELE